MFGEHDRDRTEDATKPLTKVVDVLAAIDKALEVVTRQLRVGAAPRGGPTATQPKRAGSTTTTTNLAEELAKRRQGLGFRRQKSEDTDSEEEDSDSD